MESDLELLNYRRCFVIVTEQFQPEKHDKKKMLVGLDIPDKVVMRSDTAQTELTKEVASGLYYGYDGRMFLGEPMVVLL
jgi:hypothetical protein